MTKRYKPTDLERETRREARAARRVSIAERVELLREWHTARSLKAVEKAREKAAARNSRPRGVDRVPVGLGKGNPLQRAPRPPATQTRQQRRQAERESTPTQRGDQVTLRYPTPHHRPRRRRDLPGAEARRIERNRKAWLS